jgi:membrane protein
MRRTFKECLADDVLDLAAQLGYYFLFALFPALLCVIAITSFFPLQHLTDDVVRVLGPVLPREGLTLIQDQMLKIAEGRNGGLVSVGFLGALWTSSSAMVGMIDALNKAYDIEEGRPWWRVRLTAILLTVALAVFMVISFALVIAGPELADKLTRTFGFGSMFATTWKIVQWPIALFLVSLGIGLVYYYAPDAEQDWIWITPGSVLATLLWLVVSLAFRYYVVSFGNYEATYGAIGAVIVLLTWLYLSGLVILVGAEMNAEIEHASPWAKAPGEKVPGERRKLGPAAERAYHDAQQRGFRPPGAAPVSEPRPLRALPPAAAPRGSGVVAGALAAWGILRAWRRRAKS